MPRIALRPTFGTPEMADVADLDPEQLYDALEAWGPERNYGRKRSQEAVEFRQVANPILKTIRAELKKRNLPTKRPLYGPEYYRGYDDARNGTAPDYSQERGEDFQDYCAGYRAGLKEVR